MRRVQHQDVSLNIYTTRKTKLTSVSIADDVRLLLLSSGVLCVREQSAACDKQLVLPKEQSSLQQYQLKHLPSVQNGLATSCPGA